MKKRILLILPVMILTLLLAGCGCEHEWYAATCSAPKTCHLCGVTEGEALPHTWQEATCIAPKTCSVCQVTEGQPLPHTWQEATCTRAKTCSVCQTVEGEPLPHTWQEATCTAPKTCSVCLVTEGEPAAHTWKNATCTTPKTCSVCKATEGKVAAHKWQEATTEAPKTCSVCKATEGSKLNTDSRFTTASTKNLQGTWICDIVLTDEMTGLENFGNINAQLNLTFGKTGELSQTITIKDEKNYLAKLKKYSIDLLYASLAEQGLSKEESDQAMLEAYGLNVNDYVEASLKGYDVAAQFSAYTYEAVYYVQDGALYAGLSWKANFEKSEYTLKDGKLKIDGLSLEEGGTPLTWIKK